MPIITIRVPLPGMISELVHQMIVSMINYHWYDTLAEIEKSTLSALESLVDSIGTNHPYNAMTQLMEEVMIDYEINMKLDNVQLWHNKKTICIHQSHYPHTVATYASFPLK